MNGESDEPDRLMDLLDLQDAGEGLFVGPPAQQGVSRVFGGQIIAQALASACFTVDGWACHSLHGYFLRPGKPGRPTEYEVSAMRDGESFATRNVVAVQRDEVNFQLVASFMREEGDSTYQVAMPDVPAPDTFPPEEERLARMLEKVPPERHDLIKRRRPIEAIRVDDPSFGSAERSTGPTRTWMRARGELVDDPNLHRCVLAYASDLGALEPCMRATGASFGDPSMQVASLDHAVWFHRDLRMDDWNLFVFESDSVAHGRGYSRGRVFSRDGRLVASIAQEGVIRARD